MRFKQVILAFLLGCMAGPSEGLAIGPSPRALNPKSYRSRSGEFVWTVDPSDLYGRGEGSYRLTRGGAVVWSGTRPFTLFDADVTDDGVIAGYAYTHGEQGFSEAGYNAVMGDFVIVILDATGQLRLHEVVPRRTSRILHAPPDPLAEGLIGDAANDRLVVRVHDSDLNHGREAWWTYRLSSGEALGKFELVPGDEHIKSPLRAEPVAGTPLTLLHYWRYKDPDVGARFALVDLARKEVWSLTWPRDYRVRGDEEAEDRLREKIWAEGAILDTSVSNQFTIFSAANSERITYSVSRHAKETEKWVVKEIARQKHRPAEPEPARLPPFEDRALKHLGTFVLWDEPAAVPTAVRDIRAFDFDDRERIGFLREEPDDQCSFVLIESDGRLIREMPLKLTPATPPNQKPAPNLAWLEGDRWLVTLSDSGIEGKASAWWLNTLAGELRAIRKFECAAIESLTGSRDGGFLALVTHRFKHTMVDELIAFDKTGRIRWRIKQDYNGDERALFSPEAIACTTERKVVVLDIVRYSVQFFDSNGTYLRTIKLEQAWDRKPNYPSEIAADQAGGILIRDFHGSPPIVRMSADGKVLSQFGLKHRNGRIVDPLGGVKVSPAGRVWVCDGESFIRVTDEGVADLVRGEAPSTDQIGDIAALTVDQEGRLYAVDDRTGAVHVYDRTGTHLRVCKPAVSDFSEHLFSRATLGVTPEGAVFLSDGEGFPEAPRFIHFAPEGQRIGVKRLSLDSITENWYPLPFEGRLLVLGYHAAFIVGRDDKVIRTIQRRPDGNWLENPELASIAPGGSFAIVSGRGFYAKRTWFVNLYSPVGDPVRTITMSAACMDSCFAYTGKHLVTRTESDVVLFNDRGEPVLGFRPPMDGFKDDTWECFATLGGRELWLLCAQRKMVARFDLP